MEILTHQISSSAATIRLDTKITPPLRYLVGEGLIELIDGRGKTLGYPIHPALQIFYFMHPNYFREVLSLCKSRIKSVEEQPEVMGYFFWEKIEELKRGKICNIEALVNEFEIFVDDHNPVKCKIRVRCLTAKGELKL